MGGCLGRLDSPPPPPFNLSALAPVWDSSEAVGVRERERGASVAPHMARRAQPQSVLKRDEVGILRVVPYPDIQPPRERQGRLSFSCAELGKGCTAFRSPPLFSHARDLIAKMDARHSISTRPLALKHRLPVRIGFIPKA